METPTKIPLDVLGYIADMLEPHDGDTTVTLKTLSLTCKFMVPICRRQLFSNISFSVFRRSEWRTNRSEFLRSHPIFTKHSVKNLRLDVNESQPFSAEEYDLLQLLCDSSSLTSIQIKQIDCEPTDWNKLPAKTKSDIFSLIQIPTLRRLTLIRVDSFPAAAFSLFCGLTELALHDIPNLAPPSADDATQSPKISTLVSLTCSVALLMSLIGQNKVGLGNSNIAFKCLRDASFQIDTQAEVPQICKLLDKVTYLEELRIIGDFYMIAFHSYADGLLKVNGHEAFPAGIGLSLAANPQPKLRYVNLDLSGFDGVEESDIVLNGLNNELGRLSEKNVLEVLVVHMWANVDSGFHASIVHDDRQSDMVRPLYGVKIQLWRRGLDGRAFPPTLRKHGDRFSDFRRMACNVIENICQGHLLAADQQIKYRGIGEA
ncbi:hypothetical protein HYPSUDRAFT_485671 [Hypholoma sublateritium FD-334 SS-4]|uniref:F-box domain-containing protein n=1 Tax=Hypholoma sublateritium (strain FD-334 SS-4) TaxID=945553 RepID=A0A0D2LSJ2_HYPSF|nr:hypothetical protein HYPSUDRAFT_485671 [Hypholoma sublateritium FD-334 SS-4]